MGKLILRNIVERYKNLPVQMKASFWFLTCSFLQRGISFVTTPIFTRILSTAEYGEFSVFNSWLQIITPIISLNLYSGVYSQGVVKFDDDRDRFSSSLQGLSLTLIAFWSIVYFIFRSSINSMLTMTTVQFVSLIIMIWANGSFSFWSMDQRVDFKYKKLVLIIISVSIIQPIVGITVILNSDNKVISRIISIALIQLLFYFGTFISQMKKGKSFFNKRYWFYALKFNIPLIPHYLSLTILSASDRIMISNICGNNEAGIYNLAYSVSQIMVIFNTALLQTLEPWIYKKIKAGKINEISKIAYPSFLLIAGVNLLLIMFAPEVIAIFAPADYMEAIEIIPSVALSVFFMFLYTFFATFEFYYEKTKYIAFSTVIGAVLNIILNYIFIKKYGYIAAGYTTLISYILFAVMHYVSMQNICREKINGNYPYSTKAILILSCLSIFLGLIFLFLYKVKTLRYIVILLTFIIFILLRKKIIYILKAFISLKKEGER